jgi:hypothetical protein
MWDYYAHTRRRGDIKVERNSHRLEYAIVISKCSKKRQSFTKGTKARGSNTTITTPTPDVSRRLRANLHQAVHQAAQVLPPFENHLVGEGLNEPPNSQGCKQCGIITHTQKRKRQY